MTIRPTAITLRSKKLGVMLRDARLSASKSIEECAHLLGIAPQTFAAYEVGESSPSLPELELLAVYLNVPMDHFWGQVIKTDGAAEAARLPREPLFRLRNRVIGAQLRAARQEAGLSLEALAEKLNLTPEQMKQFELGENPIPVPLLELLAQNLNRPIQEFQDQNGPLAQQGAGKSRPLSEFEALPPDLQAFVCKPVNRPYLELAQRLSEMSVDKLRAVAEGLLEITL